MSSEIPGPKPLNGFGNIGIKRKAWDTTQAQKLNLKRRELLMSKQIVPQAEEEVKRCAGKHCNNYVFRDGLCCYTHFVVAETAAWDDHADEVAQAHAVSVGRG